MRCLVISPHHTDNISFEQRTIEGKFEEFVSLVRSLKTIEIVKTSIVRLPKIQAGTFFGKGKLNEFCVLTKENDIRLVSIDAGLSPMQQRNLERALKTKVIDRTGLILEIFGNRARTKEGTLQVDLAYLEYQKSRLVRSWTHLERQRGGVGFIGGPGETQIESDRRALADKISRIKKLLRKVMQTRLLHRKNRKKNNIPVVALVGYTNAGKSSIFNFLTNSEVFSADMLFATLDPTMRAYNLLGEKKIILSDTVGFISNLPTGLITAFKATLEEVVNADLILHVRDISHPETKYQAIDVEKVIDELDWRGRVKPPIIEIYNKIDRLEKPQLDALKERVQQLKNVILLSAVSGKGFQYLIHTVKKFVAPANLVESLFIDFSDSRRRAWLFNKNVVSREVIVDDGFLITVVWSKDQKNLYKKVFSKV